MFCMMHFFVIFLPQSIGYSLKISEVDMDRGLEVSHIGFLNSRFALGVKRDISNLTVWMIPAPNLLHEVVIFGSNARALVEEAIRKIPVNYSPDKSLLNAFYRETVQKRRRYISVSEAVIDSTRNPLVCASVRRKSPIW